MKTTNVLAALRLTILCTAIALCVLPFRTAQAAQFIPLGEDTGCRGVSGDGSFAVGEVDLGGQALRWSTSSGESLSLGDGSARAASQSGSVVVGTTNNNNIGVASRWTENAGMQALTGVRSRAEDVSADGSIVVGTLLDHPVYIDEAFRWTDAGGIVGLGTLPGGIASRARGVSADGSIVVGDSAQNSVAEAFLWTEAGGMQGLGHLPGDTHSWAFDISADGSTAVGESNHPIGNISDSEAFRWTASSGMVGLGRLPGLQYSYAYAVSGDGSVVVGSADNWVPETGDAFIWDETNGMRRLQDVLTAAGLDLTGWRLQSAGDVSDDGNVVVGYGDNPAGRREGWIARLNVVPDFNNDGQLNCTDIDALVAEIAAGTNSSLFDLTGDGLVDIADLDEWRVQAGAANLPSGNPYLPGDANLDGAVDASDFNIWNSNRLSQTAAWCAGDFNADGFIDVSDFNVWNSHRLMSSAGAPAAVPEPASLWLALVAMGWLAAYRRRG